MYIYIYRVIAIYIYIYNDNDNSKNSNTTHSNIRFVTSTRVPQVYKALGFSLYPRLVKLLVGPSPQRRVKSEVVRGVEQQPRWYHILIIHIVDYMYSTYIDYACFSLYHSDYTYSCLYIYIYIIYIYIYTFLFFSTHTHIYIYNIHLLMDKL